MTARPASMTALSALAGAAMPLAFAPFGQWWLAPVCYALLFLAWQDATPRQAFVRGWSFGCAQFLCGIYWIYISVHEIGQAPVWLALFLMLGLVMVMALYPALVGWVAARWFGTKGSWHWLGILPALWIIAEWLRGWLFTGFGWLSPGYAQTESWLLGFAPLFGLLGVGWAVFLLAGATVVGIRGSRRERISATAIVVVIFSAGFITDRLAWTTPKANEITVALAQGAIAQELKWRPEQLPGIMTRYSELTLDALGSDLIIWPEAAIPELYEYMEPWLEDVERLVTAADSELMLGMLRYHEGGAQNAVFTLGQPDSVYVKRHLVPYGEYFPVPRLVRSWLMAMNLPNIDTEPGEPGQPPIELLGERIAVTICYEDVFGAEQLHSFPEATLLVNVSNDAWFGDSIAAPQHLQIARLRAAEVRRYQLRATNTGLTAVIDPFGNVTASLPQFEAGVLRSTVRGVTGSTPYIVWGNWPVLLLAFGIAAAGVVSVARARGRGRGR